MPSIKNPAIRERNSVLFFGCSEAEALALNDGKALRDRTGIAVRFLSQRNSAFKRGVSWEITFPEWLGVWRESGLLGLRGVGRNGYCMARHGDRGPYKVGNVSILSCVQNSRDGIKKAHRSLRASGRASVPAGSGRGWTKRDKGTRQYQVVLGRKYIGCFLTEQEARDAYLAAAAAHVGGLSV